MLLKFAKFSKFSIFDLKLFRIQIKSLYPLSNKDAKLFYSTNRRNFRIQKVFHISPIFSMKMPGFLLNNSTLNKSLINRRNFSERVESNNNILIEKAQEMLNDAEDLITEKQYDQAEFLLLSVNSLTKVDAPKLWSKSQLNLAFIYLNLNKLDFALKYYEEAVESTKVSFGSDSIEHALALSSYAELLYETKNEEKSLEYSRNAVEILKNKDELKMAMVMSNLAGYLMETGKPQEAKPICLQALQVLVKTLGRSNSFTQACHRNFKSISEAIQQGSAEKLEKQWQVDISNERTELSKFGNEEAEKDNLIAPEKLETWKASKQVRQFDVRGVYLQDQNLFPSQKRLFENFYRKKKQISSQ